MKNTYTLTIKLESGYTFKTNIEATSKKEARLLAQDAHRNFKVKNIF